MLFKKEYVKLNNKYDFDQKPTIDYSLKDLANTIKKNIDIIQNIADAQGVFSPFNHTGSDGKEITVSANKETYKIKKGMYIWDREEKDILEIITNDRRKGNPKGSTIESHLLDIGITMPSVENENYNEYLQLLYFLYMVKALVFPTIDIFNMFSEKTTDSNVGEYSERANCMTFILANLLDNKLLKEGYEATHKLVSKNITSIEQSLNNLISWKYDLNENEEKAKKIYEEINYLTTKPNNYILSVTDGYKVQESILDQFMYYIYRFSFVSFSDDLLNNLSERKNLFCCTKLELEDEFSEYIIQMDKEYLELGTNYNKSVVDEFVRNEIVIKYCLQKEKLNSKNKKDFLSHNAIKFLHKLIAEEIEYLKSGVSSSFVIYSNNNYYIQKSYVLAIVMTYREIKHDKFEVLMKFYDGSQVRKSRTLSSHLSGNNSLAPINMVIKELFNIYFQSEYYNITRGWGYFWIFQQIDITRYILFFNILRIIFSDLNHNAWIALLGTMDQFLS